MRPEHHTPGGLPPPFRSALPDLAWILSQTATVTTPQVPPCVRGCSLPSTHEPC